METISSTPNQAQRPENRVKPSPTSSGGPLRQITRVISTLTLAVLISISPLPARDTPRPTDPGQAILPPKHGGYGLIVKDRIIAAHDLNLPLVPASTLKILTALIALDLLGSDYRFKTEFYLNERHDLLIKGFGDPFLVSEELSLIIKQLNRRGIREINDLIIDGSAFALESSEADGAGDSLNPYDAHNSSIAVNFNTVNLLIDAAGRISSAEAQTPVLPIMKVLGKGLAQGRHRIRISAGPDYTTRLTGELFGRLWTDRGFSMTGGIRTGRLKTGQSLIYRHYSRKTLLEIIRDTMRYSNNFMANQIFLTIGSRQFGYPASWNKARRAVAAYLHQKNRPDWETIKIVEGAGISRKNRITVGNMLAILEEFIPYANLLPEKNGVLIKSGTLTGVYAYAGYFRREAELSPFALILNQPENTRDQLLAQLHSIHQENLKNSSTTPYRAD